MAAGAGASAVLAEEIRELKRGHLSATIAELRDSHRAAIRRAHRAPRVLGVPRRTLESIAECESHGDPRAVSSDGTYRGKYQFDRGTWRSNGGILTSLSVARPSTGSRPASSGVSASSFLTYASSRLMRKSSPAMESGHNTKTMAKKIW